MEIIHIVLGKANPDRMNGVNKVVYQLATQQAAMGRSVQVWGITNSPVHDYGTRNFKTRLFKAARFPWQIDGQLKAAILARCGNAIFHVHGGWVPNFWAVTRELRADGISYIFTPHGAYNRIAMQRSWLRKRVYFHLFERSVIGHARQLHCIGESEVAGLQQLLPSRSSQLLPYGFEVTMMPTNSCLKRASFVVGYMGRLDIHTKGLDLLLAAFAQFRQSVPDAKLSMVGDGKDRAALEAMIAEMGLEADVQLWGGKFGKEKWDLLQQMQVFVHPSRNEGLPSAVLEAASLGVPSIVSEATNLGSYVRDYKAGVVIPDEDVAALTMALGNMYAQQATGQLAAMGMNAGRMLRGAFDWSRIVLEFDKMYAAR